MTVRIYGKRINEWKATDEHGREIITQIEREYTDYNSITGEVVGCGSEDIPVHVFPLSSQKPDRQPLSRKRRPSQIVL